MSDEKTVVVWGVQLNANQLAELRQTMASEGWKIFDRMLAASYERMKEIGMDGNEKKKDRLMRCGRGIFCKSIRSVLADEVKAAERSLMPDKPR